MVVGGGVVAGGVVAGGVVAGGVVTGGLVTGGAAPLSPKKAMTKNRLSIRDFSQYFASRN